MNMSGKVTKKVNGEIGGDLATKNWCPGPRRGHTVSGPLFSFLCFFSSFFCIFSHIFSQHQIQIFFSELSFVLKIGKKCSGNQLKISSFSSKQRIMEYSIKVLSSKVSCFFGSFSFFDNLAPLWFEAWSTGCKKFRYCRFLPYSMNFFEIAPHPTLFCLKNVSGHL